MSFKLNLLMLNMDSIDSEKEIYLKYCEECIKSKIFSSNYDNPPELTEEAGKEKGL